MRMKNFLALAATALIAYSGTVSAQDNCAERANLILTIMKYHIDLNDKMPICISVPGEFEIRIINPPGGGHTVLKGHVMVEQKDNEDEAVVLISGDNNSPLNTLTVRVIGVEGKTFEPGDEFDFWIKIKDVGMLDPRIRVINSSEP